MRARYFHDLNRESCRAVLIEKIMFHLTALTNNRVRTKIDLACNFKKMQFTTRLLSLATYKGGEREMELTHSCVLSSLIAHTQIHTHTRTYTIIFKNVQRRNLLRHFFALSTR